MDKTAKVPGILIYEIVAYIGIRRLMFYCNVCDAGAADSVRAEEAGRGGGRVLGRDLRLHPDHRGRLRGQDVSARGQSFTISSSNFVEKIRVQKRIACVRILDSFVNLK